MGGGDVNSLAVEGYIDSMMHQKVYKYTSDHIIKCNFIFYIEVNVVLFYVKFY